MAIHTNAVDWEERIDLDRLGGQRPARLHEWPNRSELGAVLSFDFADTRYTTATHIGTRTMDKLIRFALLVRDGERVVRDFGSAARHHQLYNPWFDYSDGKGGPSTGARAGISTLRGAFHPDAGIAEDVAAKIAAELRDHGLAGRTPRFRQRGQRPLRRLETQAPQPPSRHSYRITRDWDHLRAALEEKS